MIAKRIEQKVFRDIAPQVIRHIKTVPQKKAQGLVKAVYDQMSHDFQVVPPITLHSPVPEVLAGVWSIVRESMVAGPVSRVDREAVAAAVSKINECPFCVDVHTTMLHGGNEHSLANELLSGKHASSSSKTHRIVEWALATRSPDADLVQSPPFSPEEAPTIIGTAVAFHYINRMVNVFLEETPIRLPAFLKWFKKPVSRLAGSLIGKRVMRLFIQPGGSLAFLDAAELPDDFSWASGNESVAGAFARFTSVMEDAGKRVVPPRVREIVLQHVDGWNGDELGISRGWVEEAVADLPANEQASGRLALLTALASYRVEDDLIAKFRQHFPTDEQLISTAAWASYVATRNVASWLHSSTNSRKSSIKNVTAAVL